jgi:hypothetical protein
MAISAAAHNEIRHYAQVRVDKAVDALRHFAAVTRPEVLGYSTAKGERKSMAISNLWRSSPAIEVSATVR